MNFIKIRKTAKKTCLIWNTIQQMINIFFENFTDFRRQGKSKSHAKVKLILINRVDQFTIMLYLKLTLR